MVLRSFFSEPSRLHGAVVLSLASQLCSEKALSHLGLVHTHPQMGLISDSSLYSPSVPCSLSVDPAVGDAVVSRGHLTRLGIVSDL